jgi:DnaK suppressor protein
MEKHCDGLRSKNSSWQNSKGLRTWKLKTSFDDWKDEYLKEGSTRMARTRAALLAECRKRLLKTKQDLMNGLQASRGDIEVMNGGDEADQAADFQQKAAALAMRESSLRQLREIDAAMGRIEDGTYGVCEETEEPIEEERLLALPWTRLSVEGAELRDRRKAKFA